MHLRGHTTTFQPRLASGATRQRSSQHFSIRVEGGDPASTSTSSRLGTRYASDGSEGR
jgi:hypothetical protein